MCHQRQLGYIVLYHASVASGPMQLQGETLPLDEGEMSQQHRGAELSYLRGCNVLISQAASIITCDGPTGSVGATKLGCLQHSLVSPFPLRQHNGSLAAGGYNVAADYVLAHGWLLLLVVPLLPSSVPVIHKPLFIC